MIEGIKTRYNSLSNGQKRAVKITAAAAGVAAVATFAAGLKGKSILVENNKAVENYKAPLFKSIQEGYKFAWSKITAPLAKKAAATTAEGKAEGAVNQAGEAAEVVAVLDL